MTRLVDVCPEDRVAHSHGTASVSYACSAGNLQGSQGFVFSVTDPVGAFPARSLCERRGDTPHTERGAVLIFPLVL